MNEFENYMKVREIVSNLIEAIDEIEDSKEKSENLEYAIKMLQDQKEK